MATERQKALAKLIVENASLDKPMNAGEMLENVGYSITSTEYPKRVIEADGVQEELEVLGFTERNAKTVVQDILLDVEADKNSRLKAADMVFKVQGSYAPDKNINININSEQTEEQRVKGKLFEEWLKNQQA